MQPRKEYIKSVKFRALQAYGGKCACCGEDMWEFLTIDHKNNDGSKHRAETGLEGMKMYLWLVKNNFPPEFQVLCWGCNLARHQYGVCPHVKRPSMPKPLRYKTPKKEGVQLTCTICHAPFKRQFSRSIIAKEPVCSQPCRISLIRLRKGANNRPPKEELKAKLETMRITALCKEYQVGHKAIKRWAKNYGLDWRVLSPYTLKSA